MFRTLLVAGLCMTSLSAYAQKYTATLDAAQEVPPKTSSGSGTATMTLDGDKLTYDVTYKDLTGPATAAHIHGPADAGANAAVMVPFSNPANPIKGTVNLTPEQVTALKAGKEYVNVHTAQNPGGEIRGQIKPAS